MRPDGCQVLGLAELRPLQHPALTPLPVLTPAQRLRVVPIRVPHIDALDDGRPLLQGVTRVTGELHDCPQVVGGVGGGEVPILNIGLVAVPLLKAWEGRDNKIRNFF